MEPIESGPQMYDDMVLAYDNGAKYIAVFNYPTLEGNSYGILTQEHFDALQKFWNKIQNQQASNSFTVQNVLVLPRNYSWACVTQMTKYGVSRGPDEKSPQIWNATQNMLNQYFPNIDIVYDDPLFQIGNIYAKIYHWNTTVST